jgi:transglutaminase-like putative cysteine protease
VCPTDVSPQKAPVLIQNEYDIHFYLTHPTPMVALLHLHPKHTPHLATVPGIEADDRFHAELVGPNGELIQAVPVDEYLDSFGNLCSRFLAPAGALRLHGRNIVTADDFPELQGFNLPQTPVEQLPTETLQFLLASRYCEVDLFGSIAHDLFGHLGTGWSLAASIRDWVHEKVSFDYNKARPTMTAMDVFSERIGVCRDYQHLAVTLTRCMKIPARYVTGYIGDIRVPYSGPGDFSAWYQIWIDGRWWDMDARHNYARTGRILMATGRDAADVAITTSFGGARLTSFYVDSFEIDPAGNRVPLVTTFTAPPPTLPTI